MAFSYDEMDAELKGTTQSLFWSVLGLTLLVGAGALVFSRVLTRRLTSMTAAAEEIAEGNFDVSLPLESPDEVGDLARGFKYMIGEVKTRGAKLEEREAHLRMVGEGAAEGIITANEDRSIRRFNGAAERSNARGDHG